jgi:predicted nucleotidyltransferase
MSEDPEVPPAPRLRAIREAWLRRATGHLEADPAVSAAGLVGSLGRGDADDWSDIDLLIVVPDGQVSHYADQTRKAASAHRLLQLSLIPVAGKYVARRSSDAGRMVQFVGGPHAPEASPAEHLATLRQLLVQHSEETPQEMLAANSSYLDLVAAAL